jgi:hypothetical protein
MDGRLWRLEDKSEHRGEVIIRDAETKERRIYSTAKYHRDRREVWTLGQLSDMFNMHKKSMSRWLSYLDYPYYEIVYHEGVNNPISSKMFTKYYSREQIISLYDMIVRIRRAGYPAKDRFKEPKYNLPTKAELLGMLNESELYYIKKDGKFVPVFRPEWT